MMGLSHNKILKIYIACEIYTIDGVELEVSRRTRGFNFFPILLILVGLVSTALSIDYQNFIAVLTGIALIFFGILFVYITPNIFVRRDLLENVSSEYIKMVKTLVELGAYHGAPYFISPNTAWGVNNCVLYISKDDSLNIPDADTLSEKSIDPMRGLIIDAPGLSLLKMYENQLGVNFSSVSLDYVKENIKKAVVEELELAKNITIDMEFSKINVQLIDSVFERIFDSNNINIGDPLIDSLACAFAKASRFPVKIDSIE